MFAPHCPTCATRVLLSVGRIVHLAARPEGGHVVLLRCRCGNVLSWDSHPATPPIEAALPVETTLAGAAAR